MDAETAARVVDSLINDLSDRKGIGNEWDEIDSTTQNEIREAWIQLVMENSPQKGE